MSSAINEKELQLKRSIYLFTIFNQRITAARVVINMCPLVHSQFFFLKKIYLHDVVKHLNPIIAKKNGGRSFDVRAFRSIRVKKGLYYTTGDK